MSGPDVNTDGIRSHAGHVTSLAHGVDEASDAAQTTLDGKAFGLMCMFLVPLFEAVESHFKDGIDTVGSNLTTAGTALQAMASDYDDGDAAVADVFHELAGS